MVSVPTPSIFSGGRSATVGIGLTFSFVKLPRYKPLLAAIDKCHGPMFMPFLYGEKWGRATGMVVLDGARGWGGHFCFLVLPPPFVGS